jgi:hypothetical protein
MEFNDSSTLLDYDSKNRLSYESFQGRTAHSGQLKLLIGDIMFFTLFYKGGPATCVYAGAAPGVNIMILAGIYPELRFELYDTNYIFVPNDLSDRVKVHNTFFKDSDALLYANRNDVYFLSDIRSDVADDASKMYANEVAIIKDMYTQKRWVELIKPVESMLKFRLPFNELITNRMIFENTPHIHKINPPLLPDKFRYLRGYVMLQAFGPYQSTECRLIPIRASDGSYEMFDYDYPAHEEIMFYHNTVTRVSKYRHPASENSPGYDDQLLRGYLLNDYDAAYYLYACMIYQERKLRTKPFIDEVDSFAADLLEKFVHMLEKFQEERHRLYRTREQRQIFPILELQKKAIAGERIREEFD